MIQELAGGRETETGSKGNYFRLFYHKEKDKWNCE